MDNAQRCRAMALLCRQQAALHPEQNWKWLGQAERWEHLAESTFIQKVEAPKPEPGSAEAGRSIARSRTRTIFAGPM
jgi:hypothetical protein